MQQNKTIQDSVTVFIFEAILSRNSYFMKSISVINMHMLLLPSNKLKSQAFNNALYLCP